MSVQHTGRKDLITDMAAFSLKKRNIFILLNLRRENGIFKYIVPKLTTSKFACLFQDKN